MSEQKPGVTRRFFKFIGSFLNGIRHLFSLLFLVILVSVISQMFSQSIQPVPQEGALDISLSGQLVDQKTYIDPIDQILFQANQQSTETLIRDVIEAIDTARTDDRITHIILKTGNLNGGGLSKLQEIGMALKQFSATGKPIISMADGFTQSQYFLAAHADEIMLNPLGAVMLTGLDSYRSYFKDALDKLKITMNIFRVGDYKSAVEPLTRNSMSPQVKEEARVLLGDLWQVYTNEIESLRQLNTGSINNYANNLPKLLAARQGDTAALAKSLGLIDTIADRSAMREYLIANIAGQDDDFNSIDMDSYLMNTRLVAQSKVAKEDSVAVVVASGSIMDGQQPEGSIGGDTLAEIFSSLGDDKQIKSVVLRIDSGGGSAFASEIIREAITDLQGKNIPVVVSMGSVAASGGYWIAADANHIMAMPSTITGSIGVFGIIPTIDKSLAALGVYSDGVGTTKSTGMWSMDRPLSEQTKTIVQMGVDNIYDQFVTLVAEGRDSSPEDIHNIAQGKVWSGNQALKNGLIDELGDLNAAIEVAADLANLDDYRIDYIRKEMSPIELLITQLNTSARHYAKKFGVSGDIESMSKNNLQFYINKITAPLARIEQLNDPRGIYLFCEKCTI
ncbi:MAG: signal peptide peptidase SppA [Porticoccaceae bacterium]|nr:signal peptide peptidase SppA [Porticoccaceae bacterium]MDG1473447.1 signal peptide peptidase SppA [Porticoccaceae bacterium]